MGKASRTKGASAERELSALLFDELGIRLQRRVGQCRDGGCDLEVHPEERGPIAARLARFSIEVKRHATASPHLIERWWQQAVEQAKATYRIPVLAYRADRLSWRFVVPLTEINPSLPALSETTDYTAELSSVGFCALVREGAP